MSSKAVCGDTRTPGERLAVDHGGAKQGLPREKALLQGPRWCSWPQPPADQGSPLRPPRLLLPLSPLKLIKSNASSSARLPGTPALRPSPPSAPRTWPALYSQGRRPHPRLPPMAHTGLRLPQKHLDGSTAASLHVPLKSCHSHPRAPTHTLGSTTRNRPSPEPLLANAVSSVEAHTTRSAPSWPGRGGRHLLPPLCRQACREPHRKRADGPKTLLS